MSQIQNKEIEEARQDLDVFLRAPRTQRPQSQVAKAIGVSGSRLSQFLGDTYPGDNAEMAAKVRAYLERESRLLENRQDEFHLVETSVYKRLRDTSEICYEGKIGLAYGTSGSGKTKASELLAKNDPAIIRLEGVPGYGLNEVLRLLCDALKVRYSYTIPSMFEAARDRLRGSGRLIMVDEADYLTLKTFDCLRRLHDLTQVGMLFIGPPKLNFIFRDRPDYKMVDNRVRIRVSLDTVTLADAKKIVAANAPACNGIVPKLYEAAQGDARRMESLIDMVLRLSKRNKSAEIDADMVAEAARYVDKGE